jgi:2-keto-3-deoxy-L-rhamnonate aldolase RhmA
MSSFRRDDLRQKLLQGKTVYGTCITSNAARWPSLVADSGLDFVFLDTEHIAIDRTDLSRMCLDYQARGLTPIVRIRRPDPYRASQAIDDGAIGVIAPYLENTTQIKDLIGAVKYRPLKGEKLEEILCGKATPRPEMDEYIKQFNHGNLCIANIESVPAIERLDELLSLRGLDAVFIGPHDLSINMGIPEQYDHPDFIAMVKTIIQKAKKYSLGVGIHFSLNPQRQIDWLKEGVNIVVHSSDMALFVQRLRADIKQIKTAAGEINETPAPSESVTI